jgi:hypothetical protein
MLDILGLQYLSSCGRRGGYLAEVVTAISTRSEAARQSSVQSLGRDLKRIPMLQGLE